MLLIVTLCQNSLNRDLKIRVVGCVFKLLVTHFEMLIVSFMFFKLCRCFASFDPLA